MMHFLSGLILMSSFQNVDVVKVQDGDTLSISLPDQPSVFGQNLGVRVKGIDAPELTDGRICMRREALNAKEALTILVHQGNVDLNQCERDKYFRVLCNVRVAEKYDAASYLIERGLVVPYSGGAKKRQNCKK